MEVKSYKDLKVWNQARVFVKTIYIATKKFPKEEQFSLTSQIRRCAISIPSNIAEGYSRHGLKDYISFLSIAFGSTAELETQLLLASDLEYITVEECNNLLQELLHIQKMLYKLRDSLKAKL
ncbi:MAG: four helix bundle protein [Rickettsiales bacterium]